MTEQYEKKEIARKFLVAWYDSLMFRQELVPLLAETIGVEPADIVYQSQVPQYAKSFQWDGVIRNTSWKFAFHGIAECTLFRPEDTRILELKFGPYGRYDTFSGWDTLLFVMASTSPWPEYHELKDYFAEDPQPHDFLTGDYHLMREIESDIMQLDLFEIVNRSLYELSCELYKTYRDGVLYSPPAPYNDLYSRLYWDLEMSGALVLSQKGQQLFRQGIEPETFYPLWEAAVE